MDNYQRPVTPQEALASCPFCGNDDPDFHQDARGTIVVVCSACNAQGPWGNYMSETMAAMDWNRRAPERALPAAATDWAAQLAQIRSAVKAERGKVAALSVLSGYPYGESEGEKQAWMGRFKAIGDGFMDATSALDRLLAGGEVCVTCGAPFSPAKPGAVWCKACYDASESLAPGVAGEEVPHG